MDTRGATVSSRVFQSRAMARRRMYMLSAAIPSGALCPEWTGIAQQNT